MYDKLNGYMIGWMDVWSIKMDEWSIKMNEWSIKMDEWLKLFNFR